MSGILAKYVDLKVHADRARTIDMQNIVGRLSRAELDAIYVGGPKIGHVLMLDSPGDPRCVLELSMSARGGDSIATLFVGHPLFNNRQSYVEGREELLTLVEDLADAGPAGIAIFCPTRKRKVNARELGVQQLLDLIRGRVAAAAAKSLH